MAEFETLLAVIRDDSPTGVDLRNSSGDVTFDRIKALRSFVTPEADPEGKGKEADWKGVARECTAALAERSKDLELATSLTDAWARLEGFAGLRDGIRLVAALCDRFWDRLHPGFTGESVDLDDRAMPLNKLGNAAASAAACAMFSAPDPRDPARQRVFCWTDHLNSALVDGRSTGANQAGAEGLLALGFMTGEEWHGRIKAVDPIHLRALLGTVDECRGALGELRILVEKRFGEASAPNLIPLADTLGDIHAHVSRQLPSPAAEEAAALADAATSAAPGAAQAEGRPGGPPVNREDALRRLDQVGEYFRTHEPHSPVALLVARAARWGRMPLEEVLKEVIPDQGALAKIWETLGVRPS
ncbi:MAG: type VI secretion system protein TssA [Myxococcota bacterium]